MYNVAVTTITACTVVQAVV